VKSRIRNFGVAGMGWGKGGSRTMFWGCGKESRTKMVVIRGVERWDGGGGPSFR
jgi:hypothetical protein